LPAEPDPLNSEEADEPPPFLGTWGRVYTAVVCYVAVLIALFYWFARTFSP